MIYLSNAFSLQMLAPEHLPLVRMRALGCRPVLAGLEWQSVVGHADTAAVLGVPCNRVSVRLQPDDLLFVAQLQGGRLPEGATTLPEGASFAWIEIKLCHRR